MSRGLQRQLPGGVVRILTVALLVLLALAGLRGAIGGARWDGPAHRDGLAVGAALEAVLIALLVITIGRMARRRDRADAAVAAKLRVVLAYALSLGVAAVAVMVIVGLHLHLFTKTVRRPTGVPSGLPTTLPSHPHPAPRAAKGYVIPLDIILYGLLAVLAIAVVVLAARYGARLRPAGPFAAGGELTEDIPDPEDLRDAVASGREALLTIDDARAAIIACYLAMERSLAGRGTVRAAADTPGELLARATAAGVVTGSAAGRLTGLFYEARFSVHPLDQAQRDAAEQALSELAEALSAQPGAAR